jgi:hypothetical protein
MFVNSAGVSVNAVSHYNSASVGDIFTQNKERKAHETMLSQNLKKRECFDSETHPNTVPIILGLDVTGSMGKIPHELIKDGLPTLMGTLIQNGVEDASLMFVAVGDHECDRYPLQVSQFESGDTELDMWLTRTYIEGGGGGNKGESYHLVWQVAANHTVTDAWTKRNQKGFLITIGDEPVLRSLPKNAIKEIFKDSDDAQATLSVDEILEAAQEKWNVFHIHINHGYRSEDAEAGWKQLLGDRCKVTTDYKLIPQIVSEIILGSDLPVVEKMDKAQKVTPTPEEVIL